VVSRDAGAEPATPLAHDVRAIPADHHACQVLGAAALLVGFRVVAVHLPVPHAPAILREQDPEVHKLRGVLVLRVAQLLVKVGPVGVQAKRCEPADHAGLHVEVDRLRTIQCPEEPPIVVFVDQRAVRELARRASEYPRHKQ